MNRRLLLTLTMITFAFGSNPASAAEIVACAKTNSGELRLVASAGDCKASEKALSWNAEGQQGATGPAGPQGDAGPAGSGGSGGGLDKFQFLGISEDEVYGPVSGFLGFNNACHATFPGSRMCTTAEVMNTVNPPDVTSKLTGVYVYVRSVIIGITSKDELVDASGVISPPSSNLSCNGWGAPSAGKSKTMVLSYSQQSKAAFGVAGCGKYQVACCAVP